MKILKKYVCVEITVSDVNEHVLLPSVTENKQGAKTGTYQGENFKVCLYQLSHLSLSFTV